MSRSPARGQVEPIAALVAVFAVCAGLTIYVGVLEGSIAAADGDRDRAAPAADRLVGELASFDAIDPPTEADAAAAAPARHSLNATLLAADRRWTAGPPTPADAERADRSVSVRVEPSRIEPGQLEVHVWPAA